jgi:hypothetical protein
VPPAKDDDMVKAFPAERANQPFRMPVLPGRARRDGAVTNAHGPEPPGENFAVNRVTIPNQVFGRLFPTASLGELPCNPLCRRVRRHSQPQDLAPAMPKNQQTIKQPKGKRRNDKEIYCGNPFGVVAQECSPSLMVWTASPLRHHSAKARPQSATNRRTATVGDEIQSS